ncbi:MAG TPA: LysE family translocator [Acidobacteriaceae bacterium]|nr:LysE family translocator [Acidobacteriaceae bacterium]
MSLLPPPRALFLFLTAAIVLLVIPGPSVMYIVARSVEQGRRAGLASASGIAAGSLVHVVAAAFGLSALLMSSAAAYSVVKYAGAVYLICLGIRKFLERPAAAGPDDIPPAPLRRVFVHGVLVEVLNPKVALFFFAFLPQFVSPDRGPVALQFLLLGLIFSVTGLASDSVWALTAGYASRWLRGNQTFLRRQKYLSGTVYIGLGLATAASGVRRSPVH